ncbi:hypothetical protein [Phormidesmis sp. 146-33]
MHLWNWLPDPLVNKECLNVLQVAVGLLPTRLYVRKANAKGT